MRRFSDTTREALRAQGWRLAEAPPDAGFGVAEIAYRPGLMPGSPGKERTTCEALLPALGRMLPAGAYAVLAPAAAYEWLLEDHHARTGAWLLAGTFTWSADTDERGYPVAVGVAGGRILTSPLPEGRGRGVGIVPLVVPH